MTGLPATPERKRAAERLRARLATVPTRDEVRRTLEDDRFRLVCPGDTEWPAGLDGLGDSAPLALWVTGSADLAMACRRSVAVTGSRAATAYGSYIGSEFGTILAERGLTVVTGGSFGIDVAAHRGAAGTGGTTITILPGGTDVPYPAAHADLLGAWSPLRRCRARSSARHRPGHSPAGSASRPATGSSRRSPPRPSSSRPAPAAGRSPSPNAPATWGAR